MRAHLCGNVPAASVHVNGLSSSQGDGFSVYFYNYYVQCTLNYLGTPRDFIKCKEELLSPEIDWETTWRRARMKGLGSEATSFLWKMLHNILPTEARLGRILPNQSQNCKFCSTPANADLLHCFFYCEKTKIVGRWLLSWMSKQDSGVSAAGLLKLEFQVEESREMPVVWLIAQTLL